jgi:accessory colonization factor AcfC
MKTYKVSVSAEYEKLIKAEDREKALDIVENDGFSDWGSFHQSIEAVEIQKDQAIERAEARTIEAMGNPFVKQSNGDYLFTDEAQDVFNTYLDEELSK